METSGCWNKNNPHADEPWAFFPQFGLPLVKQRAVMMLNYPPVTALTGKNYLNTFTLIRWSRVLQRVGIEQPVLFETIVDIRPIAAPGSGTSQNLPDAQKFFNDKSSSTGGYYITPQLNLMLNPAEVASTDSLPLIVLGDPARAEWKAITGLDDSVLNTGLARLPDAEKSTPYILGNHPDVTTYQCCPGDPSSSCDSFDLIESEEIDVQIACWAKTLSDSEATPADALAQCKQKWVTNRSAENNQTFCALARIDSNECFGKDLSWDKALSYCKSNNNNACATYACPSP